MMARIIFTFICLVFVCHNVAESRTVSMYDLKPATLIKSISKPALLGGDSPIFRNCSKTSDGFQLTNVLVAGCSVPPCPLIKGTNTSIEIDFIADKEVTAVTAKVYGQIDGIKVPFPLTNSDACSCGVACPTKAGNAYKYKYSLPIASEYPSMTLAVFWYLYDATVEELCMDVAVTIKDA
ncbi:NPC intracellular cholesterol transporter 2 homolog a [Strongylocentrotus purpuratus]|uniref:MD-2-related lipid-recognition domain-containing protein n=1 Tax=Strongylocentrotus purpuratus TaxID=7668 RepID=A0A7M7PRX4_STRPU|nr:NPC intracellular cholesterol transporter 2 homolog a [Strongylocentrotus purpuratus]